jgi:hypothetical protein
VLPFITSSLYTVFSRCCFSDKNPFVVFTVVVLLLKSIGKASPPKRISVHSFLCELLCEDHAALAVLKVHCKVMCASFTSTQARLCFHVIGCLFVCCGSIKVREKPKEKDNLCMLSLVPQCFATKFPFLFIFCFRGERACVVGPS